MRKYSLLLFTLIFFQISNAQTWAWAKQGTAGSGASKTVTTDAAGNVYIAGNFDDGRITFGTETVFYQGQTDAFITKYDPSGNVIWAKGVGGTNADYITALCTDNSGNLYFTGFHASATLNCGSMTLQGYGGAHNVFAGKCDANGNMIWLSGSGIGTCNNYSNAIAVDASGNVYITGNFTNNSITFGSYTLVNGNPASAGSNMNLFLAKFDANGNHVWAKKAGGPDYAKSNGVCVDPSGNVFITGTFRGVPISFDAITLTPTGQYDMFLAKFDASGNAVWAKSSSGSREEEGRAIGSDASGNIYVTGFYFSPTFTIDGSTINNTYPTGIPHENIFLAKYTNAGSLTWLRSAGGTGSVGGGDAAYALSVYNGGVFISGSLHSATINFGSYTLTPAAPVYDPMFVANYNANGDVLYATSFSGGGSITNSLRTDNNNNLYITGQFHYTVNPFNVGATALVPGGIETVFVAKLSSAFGLPVTLSRFTVTPMDRQLNIAWRTEQETNIDGYYIQKWNGSSFVDIGYVPSHRTSYANDYSFADRDVQANILYQYRLAVVEHGAINKYSAVRAAKINDRSAELFTYANPVKDKLEIYFTKSVGRVSLLLTNSNGQAVYKGAFTVTENSGNYVPVNMNRLPAGIYWLNVKTTDRQVVQHVIKK